MYYIVCKLWQEASRASWCNFRKLDLQDETWGNFANPDAYFLLLDKVLSRCGELITSIDLSRASFKLSIRPQGLSSLTMCPNLRELSLANVKVGVAQINLITKHCKKIDTLYLSRMTINCDDLFLEQNLFSKLNLRCLRLKRAVSLTGYCLTKLSPLLVEEIVLENCSNFDLKFLISVIISFYVEFTFSLINFCYSKKIVQTIASVLIFTLQLYLE